MVWGTGSEEFLDILHYFSEIFLIRQTSNHSELDRLKKKFRQTSNHPELERQLFILCMREIYSTKL